MKRNNIEYEIKFVLQFEHVVAKRTEKTKHSTIEIEFDRIIIDHTINQRR